MKIANLLIAAALAFSPVAISAAHAQDAAAVTTQESTTTTTKVAPVKDAKHEAKKHAAKAKSHAHKAKKEAKKAEDAAK